MLNAQLNTFYIATINNAVWFAVRTKEELVQRIEKELLGEQACIDEDGEMRLVTLEQLIEEGFDASDDGYALKVQNFGERGDDYAEVNFNLVTVS
jgi:hypothetical protein